jgi:hypothetical protein
MLAASAIVGGFLAPGGLVRAQVSAPPSAQLQGTMAAFGMVGIVPGQTARLSAVLGTAPDEEMPSSCQVHLAIIDAEGHALAEASADLVSGAATHLDYPLSFDRASRPVPRGPNRHQIRATAKAGVGPTPFGPDPGPLEPDLTPFRPCSAPMLATLEIFDTQSGQSTVILNPAVLVGFNPQPEPPMPEPIR